jgi:hypothetical protein
VTLFATYVHKSLRGSYIDALFRRIFCLRQGINLGKPMIQTGPGPMSRDYQWSEFVLLQGASAIQEPCPSANPNVEWGRSKNFFANTLPFRHSIR